MSLTEVASSDFAPFFNKPAFSDVTICFGGREVKAHRVILCGRSRVLKIALSPESPFEVDLTLR